MKLRDDQQLEAEQTIVLLRLQQVVQVVVPWLVKVLDCHLEHYWSMVTPLNVMERLVVEHLDVERGVILVQTLLPLLPLLNYFPLTLSLVYSLFLIPQ